MMIGRTKKNTQGDGKKVNTGVVQREREQFLTDTLKGLNSSPKYLSSKYFYDRTGDALFRAIMNTPEYYLTRCETEIFSSQTDLLADSITGNDPGPFDLIELGVGDGTKSRFLLTGLLQRNASFNFLPIDISGNILLHLKESLSDLDDLQITCFEGDYFDMLKGASQFSENRKVILFLGANIGNMSTDDALKFCRRIRTYLGPGDQMLIGFDLKKNPQVILNAYNDPAGLTRDFNLNLLHRINNELGADFDVRRFAHYPVYDPQTGACKSYLVSTVAQSVQIAGSLVSFREGEWIFMEISQKYSVREIEKLAGLSGFRVQRHFADSRQWFVDSVWIAE